MAGLFRAKKPESDGIEFWHNPERSGWLMKQGGCGTAQQAGIHTRLVWHVCFVLCQLGKMHSVLFNFPTGLHCLSFSCCVLWLCCRRIHQDLAAQVRQPLLSGAVCCLCRPAPKTDRQATAKNRPKWLCCMAVLSMWLLFSSSACKHQKLLGQALVRAPS